ncbi:hypothetical protein Y1Q_0002513 [Alligator mississippiensis]|uniref:Uncharacterized protein n=1 Tax=Alligator mississippiensis TaxID=8496 RepID=A0A151N8Z7_ALLMI|nr:hypothetical protein Y1Q_0002513 [Alligator mississippiensis]
MERHQPWVQVDAPDPTWNLLGTSTVDVGTCPGLLLRRWWCQDSKELGCDENEPIEVMSCFSFYASPSDSSWKEDARISMDFTCISLRRGNPLLLHCDVLLRQDRQRRLSHKLKALKTSCFVRGPRDESHLCNQSVEEKHMVDEQMGFKR